MIEVSASVRRTLNVRADLDTAFRFLSDVPRSFRCLPSFKSIAKIRENVYKQATKTIKLPMIEVAAQYTAEYTTDRAGCRISWKTLEGNPKVKGKWTLKERAGGGTQIRLLTEFIQQLPLPRLSKLAVQPLARREFNGVIDAYIKNIEKQLNGAA